MPTTLASTYHVISLYKEFLNILIKFVFRVYGITMLSKTTLISEALSFYIDVGIY